MRGLQPGGHVHKEVVHLLSLQPAFITSSGTFKPECNGPLQFREDTDGPSMPVREFNLIAFKKIKNCMGNQQCNRHLHFPGQHYSFQGLYQTFPYL